MYYIIRRGDSLHKIANHYGTTVSNLMDLNPNIHNPNQIYPGERIKVSSSGNQWSGHQWGGQQWNSHQGSSHKGSNDHHGHKD
ncbi:MAG: LysM domain-containing protein [Desulfosporosinus sp.]|nr:LysM domain-containing protein [Desulfosporosinus sp.]